ncbi:MAG: hypothetical protein PHE61_03425 [Candidatus Omnitrophica bacterium]|nr:hypothetical protein [Candidatus Omnitrophota bacterium]
MNKKGVQSALAFCLTLFVLSGCFLWPAGITITDAKTATGVNESLMPIQVTSLFPKQTSKVCCWFQWKNAKIDTKIVAKWYYTTDNIHILDYNFSIPRREGSGSVSLSMPEGKTLPVGSYQVTLNIGRRTIKALNFRIE